MSETTLYQTPTLSFGEVGQTHSTETEGSAVSAKGVGEFEDTKLLERMILVATVNWTSSSAGILTNKNLLSILTTAARNAAVLNQFTFMRCGVEVTIRINATQFYYGALMATLFPLGTTGNRLDERAVLDPTVISANCANSVIKTWKYMFPEGWLNIADIQSDSTQSVWLYLDVIAPLTVASASAAETVSVQIWARLIDVVLSYPTGTLTLKDKPRSRFKGTEMMSKKRTPPKGSCDENITRLTGKDKEKEEHVTEAQSSEGKIKVTIILETDVTTMVSMHSITEEMIRSVVTKVMPKPTDATEAQSSKGKIKKKEKKKDPSDEDTDEEEEMMDIRITIAKAFWFSLTRSEKRAYIMKLINEAFSAPIVINMPKGNGRIEAQMKKGGFKVKVPKIAVDTSPVDSAVKSATSAIDTVTQGVVGTIGTGLGAVSNLLDAGMGIAGLFLDKPDVTDHPIAYIQEPWKDAVSADIPDSNVSYSLYKQKYLDPSPLRVPLSKTMTISDYARIPGLCAGSSSVYATYTANAQTSTLNLIQLHVDSTTHKKPLDYAYINSCKWRGSIKVMIQFFTSSFITTRFVVQYNNSSITGGQYQTDYTAGLSRVIDVKGDTIDCFTLPWLDYNWWSEGTYPQLQITTISDVVSTDNSATPKIYMVVWVAGGDDIQFAIPRIPIDAEWGSTTPNKEIEAQCSIGAMFKESEFAPIGEGVELQTDNGLCMTDQIGPITDVCKRYAPLISSTVSGTPLPIYGMPSEMLDQWPGMNPGTHSIPYSTYWRFRHTYFGSWRQAFMFCSGGYRYRCVHISTEDLNFTFNTGSLGFYRSLAGLSYNTPPDKVTRLTIPQASNWPYRYLADTSSGEDYRMINVIPGSAPNANSIEYVAARDDLEFGYPILPSEITPCT